MAVPNILGACVGWVWPGLWENGLLDDLVLRPLLTGCGTLEPSKLAPMSFLDSPLAGLLW